MFPESHRGLGFPEPPEYSGMPDAIWRKRFSLVTGFRDPGDTHRSPGFRSHPELWAPVITRRIPVYRMHPELRVPGFNRNTPVSRTLSSRSHPENSDFPESYRRIRFPAVTQRTPISWSHQGNSAFMESLEGFRFHIHPENSCFTELSGGLRVSEVTRIYCSWSKPRL